MRVLIVTLAAIALSAPAAFADDFAAQRDIEAAVDSYLATDADASLVGGPGSAGYDAGFWIRGGDFLLRINATLQARFESMNWDDEDDAQTGLAGSLYALDFAGDTSGFSLPRATLKLSGEAPCNICWYMELEFGHFGRDPIQQRRELLSTSNNVFGLGPVAGDALDGFTGLVLGGESANYDNTREAWIEWCYCPVFNVRMGQIGLPTVRQMMVAPELQQFVDVSMAAAYVGLWLPGYTDRNRDHGFLVHGGFGCNNEWSYVVSVTNGDGGDSIRNVLDHRTSDNLAYGARLNWAFLAPIGYEEGALRQQTCQWYGEIGAFAFYYADRQDKPHFRVGDVLSWGVDLALGYGGFSFTGHFTSHVIDDWLESGENWEATTWLAQIGYHFPGTAFEIAARASQYSSELTGSSLDGSLLEYAFGINYYLNGHGNKLQVDVSFLDASDQAIGFMAPYPGYQPGFYNENSAILLRFQWQLAV